eukprot:scaffold22653_cov119-Cylindrotheca_fusiformis.AAC.1
MAKQVSRMIPPIPESSEPGEEEEQKDIRSGQVKSNLQLFAKLHREQRKLLGKKIFERIAKLYGNSNENQAL